MEIATGSFRSWRPDLGQPVRIALQVPNWMPEAAAWPQVFRLCPRWSYFRAAPDVFADAYLDQLDRFGVDSIRDRLHQLGRDLGAERLVLCCFEDNRDMCHRDLFAEWWRVQTGEIVAEVGAAR